MDRRVILAIALMVLVAIVPSVLWPPEPPPPGRRPPATDTVRREPAVPEAPTARPTVASPRATDTGGSAMAGDTVWVESDLYRLGFATRGGALVRAELVGYQSFAPGDSGSAVQLVPDGRPMFVHRLLAGTDTVSFADWVFEPSEPRVRVDGLATLRLVAERGGARVELEYRFAAGDYRFGVRGAVSGLGPTGAVLALGLGDGLRTVEVDSADDFRHYAVVTKAAKTESKTFRSLDPGEVASLEGPFEWVALKTKYFLMAALAIEEGRPPLGGALMVGGPRGGRAASRAAVTTTLPVPPEGGFAYQVYLGPIDHRRLSAVGHGLDDANPYGGILRGIIHPVSIFVVDILLWMHERLDLAYGWVLVIFGIMVRLLLWPLNQKAMESGLRMQAVQPLMKDIQDRYKTDPERLQKEMLRLYKEHKINPFGGCLPMLLPLPILFALFFVFANTIELRGVPFLWLPDLSRHDPLYIIPLVMGLSMFAVSKVGQMGMPPNPQAKMMLYVLPVMMTVLFINFASGLNLYYTVQNIISIPQQYLIARRRLKQGGSGVPSPTK
ncbi:MAG TPA: membrane protein insertase YidC [Gemmatimonadales bacterium]|nr:membrane protein insertase YidC [Gemmatimonadales bacterium]